VCEKHNFAELKGRFSVGGLIGNSAKPLHPNQSQSDHVTQDHIDEFVPVLIDQH
jgi:hypothetical protein